MDYGLSATGFDIENLMFCGVLAIAGLTRAVPYEFCSESSFL